MWGHLALATAALFSGAAFYINFAEQPARLTLPDEPLLTQWKPAYRRGFLMQASLAVIGFLFGMGAWWQSGKGLFLAGAVTLVLNWPYTVIGIRPTNRLLMETDPAAAGPRTRALAVRWGHLHAVRTCLGLAAMLMFLLAVQPA